MKSKSFIKRLALFSSIVTLSFIINSSDINKRNKEFFLKTTRISKSKIEYNSGIIYIGNEKYLDKIINLKDNDLLVLDNRNLDDPNFRIYNSHKIIDPLIREEIIEALLYYEELYPTNWYRTKNSLNREWLIHNIMYYLGYKLDHTTDVDLNNADENTYKIKRMIRW